MWFRKNKEKTQQEILNEMKKKNEQIEKLKEEINNMGKLIMVNGKLSKQEDKQKVETPQQMPVQQPQTQVPTQEQYNQMVEQEVQRQMMLRQQQQQQRPMPQMPPPIQQDDFPEEINQPIRQEVTEEQIHKHNLNPIVFQIEVVTGTIYEVDVSVNEIEDFVNKLNVAIDNQTSVVVGNRVINGRNIVSYTSI